MNKDRLANHVKLCRKNLRSQKVKCCATCPFEDDIVSGYTEMEEMFENKRTQLLNRKEK